MCAECWENLRANRDKLRVPRRRALLPGPVPTVAAFERHARRHGPELVAETAAEYGLTVVVERVQKRRSRGPTLKERIVELLARGVDTNGVAEVENLSPSRARRLVAEVS